MAPQLHTATSPYSAPWPWAAGRASSWLAGSWLALPDNGLLHYFSDGCHAGPPSATSPVTWPALLLLPGRDSPAAPAPSWELFLHPVPTAGSELPMLGFVTILSRQGGDRQSAPGGPGPTFGYGRSTELGWGPHALHGPCSPVPAEARPESPSLPCCSQGGRRPATLDACLPATLCPAWGPCECNKDRSQLVSVASTELLPS